MSEDIFDEMELASEGISDLEAQSNELKNLGISVVDQSTIENEVKDSINKAFVVHERKQKHQILIREFKSLNQTISKTNQSKLDLEKRINGMKSRVVDPKHIRETLQKLKEVSSDIEKKRERKKYLEVTLAAASHDDTVLDEADLDMEEGEIFETEPVASTSKELTNGKEQLIKDGSMTPFGTVVKSSIQKSLLYKQLTSGKEESSSLLSQMKKKKKPLYRGDVSQVEKSLFEKSKPSISDSPTKNKNLKFLSNYLQDQTKKQKLHSNSNSIGGKVKVVKPSCKNFSKKAKPKEYIDKTFEGEDHRKSKIKKDVKRKAKIMKKGKKSPLKKRILHPKKHWKESNIGSVTSKDDNDQYMKARRPLSESVAFDGYSSDGCGDSTSDYVPSGDEESDDTDSDHSRHSENQESNNKKNNLNNKDKGKQRRKKEIKNDSTSPLKSSFKKVLDDGQVDDYKNRVERWRLDVKKKKWEQSGESSSDEEGFEEFDGSYKIPTKVWNRLYKYQRTCVHWLWELNCQGCGGVLGDEMGLGKTIQMIAFFVGLSVSRATQRLSRWKGLGPVLIVCPTTVLHQWVKEFHTWWPLFRVAIMHDSGTFEGSKATLIHNLNKPDSILLTSYNGLLKNIELFVQYSWHYIVLDEGHKIRNPEAQITVAVKRFSTVNRIILSGSPIQNSLKELWSLFDFVFPGKLGTLAVFMQEMSVPITLGGYAHASKLEVQTAFRCATVLRDTINPYMLRRMKCDVRNQFTLPDKNEQVLFCGLTEKQLSLYRNYINGSQVSDIYRGRLKVFVGLINLRKICNHPDLFTGLTRDFINDYSSDLQPQLKYGYWEHSGKMRVLQSLLRLWFNQKHKVLLFTQSRQMMCILENFIRQEDYTYLKMAGTTSIGSRGPLIERYNNDPSIFVFLLTTRVGGLGVNLTGADRVVIFDPDWNPSTDMQARERAWRIGQKRHVTIYRLLTAGTIEEKIYHRQIFKQFLTDKVLKDPKQQRFFKSNDLYDLFTLQGGHNEKTESSALFAGTGSEIKMSKLFSKSNKNDDEINNEEFGENNNEVGEVHKEAEEKCDINYVEKEVVKSYEEDWEMDKVAEADTVCDDRTCEEVNNREKNVEKQNDDLLDRPEYDDYREQLRRLAKSLSQKVVEDKEKREKLNKSDVSDKKDKRSKSKKKKGKKFEGERIEYLVKKRKYTLEADKADAVEEKKVSASQDDFVLKELFTKSGVHTALKHDRIVNSGDKDYLLMEADADRVAQEALKRMRDSRALLNNGTSKNKGVKKKFGVAKNNFIVQEQRVKEQEKISKKRKLEEAKYDGFLKPDKVTSISFKIPKQSNSSNENRKKKDVPCVIDNDPQVIDAPNVISNVEEPVNSSSSGVLSSNDLLKRMQMRNSLRLENSELDEDDSDDSDFEGSASSRLNPISEDEQVHIDLLTDIRSFIAFQSIKNGEASTKEIVSRFKTRLPADKSYIFKALLKKICDFKRNQDGDGVWYIKGEFR